MFKGIPISNTITKPLIKGIPTNSVNAGIIQPTRWYDAGKGISKNGDDTVYQWDDQSGNGKHFVQATSSSQPLWVNAYVNGLPAIYFNQDQMSSAALSADVWEVSLYIVIRFTTTKAWPSGFFFISMYGNLCFSDGANNLYSYQRGGAWAYGFTITTGSWMVFSMRKKILNSNSGFSSIEFYKDGVAGTKTLNCIDNWSGGLPYIQWNVSHLEQYHIAEIALFESYIDDQSHNYWNNYLKSKYGI